jgi:ATP/maltotriose-dependent transcriptional regulator MalT
MDLHLLRTKLNNPLLRSNLVPRPQLIERLNEGLNHPLTVIAASAGFGKTTTLSEWIRHSERRAAWLSTDEGDNDPVRFWTYFIAALQTLDAKVGEHALAMLHTQGQGPPRAESVLTLLLDDVAALPEPFVLVLDDYHVINTPDIHQGIAFLVEHMPAPMHLYISTRSDPPLPLARWRARGQLAEIRTDDLRLTAEEAARFLNQAMGLRLSPDDVLALHARTEGWLVGLQLAALSLQGRTDAGDFIAAFRGSHHYIIDYLSLEAIQSQPESVQSFLLHTAILDRLCGALCDAVTERTDSHAILEYLERANVFTIPLDEERQWYRYHHLFAEMLRRQLQRLYPAHPPDLHRRASEWYEHNGLADEAVRHALAAEDFERAARLIEQNAGAIFWMRGEISTFLEWLEALPDDVVHAHPRLGLVLGWALLMSGKLATIEPVLEEAERQLLNSPDSSEPGESEIKSLRGQMAAIRSRVARLHDDLPRAIELARAALADLPQDNRALRSVFTLNLGMAYRQSGDVTAATRVLTQASTMGGSAGIALIALGILGDLQAEQGHLHQAAETYRQAIDRAAEDGNGPSPMVSWAWVGLGALDLEWNDLDAAEHHIRQGTEFARRWGNADGLAWAWLHLGRLKQARGDAAGAEAALIEAEQIVRRYEVAPWTSSEVAGWRGQFWLKQGNLGEVARWARERGLKVEDEFSYLREPEYLTLARLLIAEGVWEEAASFSERLLRSAEASGLTGRVIHVMLLQALASSRLERPAQSPTVLHRVLSLAEPEGYTRVFLDEGEPMRSLLSDFAQAQSARPQMTGRTPHLLAYVNRLLAAFSNSAAQSAPRSGIGPTTAGLELESTPKGSTLPPYGNSSPGPGAAMLPERLSTRELEILPLLADGLSNREIAQQLFLSTGTVKVHLKHIYGKLSVKNRTQAIARARELNLL